MGALTGFIAIELGDFQTAPGAGAILGDLGANVIKIEDPVRGDSLRGLFTMGDTAMMIAEGRHLIFETANRSKRGITLDLKTQKGKEIFYKLIDKADIFYTNYREKVLSDLGADYETLSRRKPTLVYGKIDMYGIKGPVAERRGYDFAAQARSGMMWMMGDRDSPEPAVVYGSVCDESGATMLAMGLITALLNKERNGIGQRVDVSIYGTMIHIQCTGINLTSLRGRGWARHSRKRVRGPLSNFYKCADGKWIFLVEPRADEFWPGLARALGRDDLVNNPKFNSAKGQRENYEEVIKTLDEIFITKSLAEWLQAFEEHGLDKAGFSYSPIFEYQDVISDPQAWANDYLVEFDHPAAGKLKLVGHPMSFSKTPAGIQREAPEHGQHTEEVLAELCDLDWEELARLRDEKVI
ncbi:MAG TPA: CoA transferase [Dehalococcoidia bacterium]|nr:CoA transferase [Dehalococcoidia bacterium]